ncbi:universal stress protein [Streptomyces sp. NPDC053427]|uniref:universal stress protein n=1 Tax=Streptomyces sp. NPDC053427 TaxID=3365701 RepID=UPI0037CD8C89
MNATRDEERDPMGRPCGDRRVVAGVSGSLGSLTALHRAATEAGRTGAELWAVLAWEPPGGDIPHRGGPCPPSLAAAWRGMATERLLEALDAAFGSAGPGVPMQRLVGRGTPGKVLLEAADDADDLLVVGSGARGRLRRAMWPSVARYCVARACCPVLTVPPSPLHDAFDAVHRRNVWKLPLDTSELAD